MSSVPSPLLAAGGLADIDLGLIVWTLILFGLFATILGKFGWGPILKVIEEREKTVKDAVEGAHRVKTEAEALLAQHRELLREATREREEIVKRAIVEAEQLKASLGARAKAESDQMIQRAKTGGYPLDRSRT